MSRRCGSHRGRNSVPQARRGSGPGRRSSETGKIANIGKTGLLSPNFSATDIASCPKLRHIVRRKIPTWPEGSGRLVHLAADCRSLAKGWVTGFQPAIHRSTIRGSDDVKGDRRTDLPIPGSEFAHPVPTGTLRCDAELVEITMHGMNSRRPSEHRC